MQEALGHSDKMFIKYCNAMPLRALLHFTRITVFPAFARRYPKIRYFHTALRGSNFRISSEITDQNNFINATRHFSNLSQ